LRRKINEDREPGDESRRRKPAQGFDLDPAARHEPAAYRPSAEPPAA